MKQAKKQQQQQAQPQSSSVLQDEDTQTSTIADEAENEFTINEIDKLEQQGINAADIAKLKTGGICTVMAVLMW